MWSSEYCSTWSQRRCHKHRERCFGFRKPWQFSSIAQIQNRRRGHCPCRTLRYSRTECHIHIKDDSKRKLMIKVLADQIRKVILAKMAKIAVAKWYTVIADEVTDVSNKEQLSLVVRYVDADVLLVREDVIGFVECDTGITGRCLADKITSSLQTYGLDLSKAKLMMELVTWLVQLMGQQLSSPNNTHLLCIFTVLRIAST